MMNEEATGFFLSDDVGLNVRLGMVYVDQSEGLFPCCLNAGEAGREHGACFQHPHLGIPQWAGGAGGGWQGLVGAGGCSPADSGEDGQIGQ